MSHDPHSAEPTEPEGPLAAATYKLAIEVEALSRLVREWQQERDAERRPEP